MAETSSGWSPDQIADFATLLGHLPPASLRWLVAQVLGDSGLAAAGGAIDDPKALSEFASAEMNRAGRIHLAAKWLFEEGNQVFTVGLDRIFRGLRLDPPTLQALINEYEPFFNNATTEASLAKAKRVVCAIGLVDPSHPERPGQLVGSGFLIGPDLVLTNAHALPLLVTVEVNGTISTKVSGKYIYCYFDYHRLPQPTVPPGQHTCLCVPCHENWLEWGRPPLPYDGTLLHPLTANNEFDYAVIRLSKPVGDAPARLSGGRRRGWYPFPSSAIQVITQQQRVAVVQHPGGSPQLVDFGEVEQPDPTGTRIWYTANAAPGSSGGAALDSDGNLYALHNA